MNYFEVTKRLATLRSFKKLYADYISFTNRFENPAAQILLRQMRPLVPMTIDSLRRVHIGTIIMQDAPARGGKKYKINMIKAIFRESLIKHFHLDDESPLQAVEAAVIKYETLQSRSLVQLFNPLFWIMEFVGYVAEIPFIILDKSGISTAEFKKTAAARLFKIVVILALLILIAEILGLRALIWRTLFE